jgi:hypothetical protein
MNYTVEMGVDAMIYLSNFIAVGSGIQTLLARILTRIAR